MEDGKVTVQGIEVPFDKAKLADVRFVIMLGDLNDDTLEDSEKMAAQARVMRFLFGNDRYRILDGIAESNGGNVDGIVFGAWLAQYFEAVGAKN